MKDCFQESLRIEPKDIKEGVERMLVERQTLIVQNETLQSEIEKLELVFNTSSACIRQFIQELHLSIIRPYRSLVHKWAPHTTPSSPFFQRFGFFLALSAFLAPW